MVNCKQNKYLIYGGDKDEKEVYYISVINMYDSY